MNVVLKAEAVDLERALSALTELADRFPQAVEALICTPQLLAKIVRIDTDRQPAAPADEIRVLLKPSDFLLGYVAALRACDGQGGVAEELGHAF